MPVENSKRNQLERVFIRQIQLENLSLNYGYSSKVQKNLITLLQLRFSKSFFGHEVWNLVLDRRTCISNNLKKIDYLDLHPPSRINIRNEVSLAEFKKWLSVRLLIRFTLTENLKVKFALDYRNNMLDNRSSDRFLSLILKI